MQEWAQFLIGHPSVMYVLVILFGLVIGSFLNVVIDRLPTMLMRHWKSECHEICFPNQEEPKQERFNLCVPRSRCPHCHEQIKSIHNIPLISFLLLRGKCANCSGKISWMYPIVEICFALICVWALTICNTNGTPNFMTLSIIIFGGFLLCLFMIDLRTQLLPDELTVPLLWIGLLFNISGMYTTLINAVIGAVAGYMVLWVIFWLYKLLTGKDGMGYGDFKLLSAIGAWLGWQMLPFVLVFGAVLTLLVILVGVALRKRSLEDPTPFGPGLSLAGFVLLVKGDSLFPFIARLMH